MTFTKIVYFGLVMVFAVGINVGIGICMLIR